MPSPRYIDIRWEHSNASDPVRLISSIKADGFEDKKIEVFRDGSIGYATQSSKSGDTELGSAEVPLLAEIVSQPEFTGRAISAEEFEALWSSFVHKV